MVSPNLFLKLNISFNIIIGLLVVYFNFYKNNCKLINLSGLLFIYIGINNIIILRQKSSPKLKKDILRINTLLYLVICLFILLDIKKNKKNINNFTILLLNFFVILLNYIGYKITKVVN